MKNTVQAIAEAAKEHHLHVAVAESLTRGAVASRLGAGPGAVDWFRGGAVAYSELVEFELLGVGSGPLVTEHCAQEMAHGAARLLGAEAAFGLTGAGGPEPDEGQPPGTVILAATMRGATSRRSVQFPGSPKDVIAATVARQ